MFWEKAALLSAVVEWRDAQRLAAFAFMNAAAVEALAAFGASLADLEFPENVPEDGVVALAADAEMCAQVRPRLEHWLDESARGLWRIDARLEPVAVALAQTVRSALPERDPALPPQAVKPAPPGRDPAPQTDPRQSGMLGGLAEQIGRVADAAGKALEDGHVLLRDVTGVQARAHARRLSMAQAHIVRDWLAEAGAAGKPQPVLSQIEARLAAAAAEAKEILG